MTAIGKNSKLMMTAVSCVLILRYAVLANPTLQTDTWTNIYPENSCGFGIDPSNPSTIYMGKNLTADRGLFKTTDGGSTWNRIGRMVGSSVTDFTNDITVKVDPNNSNHLYGYSGVSGTTGFWVSTDAGNTWSFPAGFDSVSHIINCQDLYGIDCDPTDFNHFLLTFHSPWATLNGTSGIVESFDGGKTCIIRNPPPTGGWNGGYNAFFLYNPALGIGDNRTWIFMTQPGNGTNDGWFKTADAGAHWTKVSDVPMVHGGSQIYYAYTGVIYAASLNGIMRSSDNGQSWQTTPGLNNVAIFAVCGDGQTLYTGSSGYDNIPLLYSPESDGVTWKQFGTQAFSRGPFKMAYDSSNGIMYASLNQAGLWALRVNKLNTGITLSSPHASPSSVIDNATTAVTLSIDATAQAGITSVKVDLTQIGGSANVSMIKASGNTYSTDFTIHSGAAPGTWHLPVVATDNSNHSLYSSIAITVTDHGAPVLVSQGKPVVVSSTQDASVPGSAAVDGNLSTRWSSLGVDPSWIYIDLGSLTPVNRVVLKWEAAYAKSYQIQVSNDANTWTDVYTTTTGGGGIDSLSFASANARYVRMYGTQRGTTFGYSLYEFAVYSPAPGATAVPSCRLAQSVNQPGLSFVKGHIAINPPAENAVWTLELFSLNGVLVAAYQGKGKSDLMLTRHLQAGMVMAAKLRFGEMTETGNLICKSIMIR